MKSRKVTVDLCKILWIFECCCYFFESLDVYYGRSVEQAIIFCSYGFYIFLHSSLFSSPILSGRRLDVYHSSTHDVTLVRFRMQI